jgi:hypothetical protein
MEIILQTHIRRVDFSNYFLSTNASADKVNGPGEHLIAIGGE